MCKRLTNFFVVVAFRAGVSLGSTLNNITTPINASYLGASNMATMSCAGSAGTTPKTSSMAQAFATPSQNWSRRSNSLLAVVSPGTVANWYVESAATLGGLSGTKIASVIPTRFFN